MASVFVVPPSLATSLASDSTSGFLMFSGMQNYTLYEAMVPCGLIISSARFPPPRSI
jgi:hypothetical protein